MNTFGRYFRLTTFGESHGPYVGGVIDGCPAGVELDLTLIQEALQRRKGLAGVSTPRTEADQPEFISGLMEGKTTGTPLAFLLPNQQKRSGDYDALKEVYRPSHADFTYQMKYGIRDHRGGGRASARESVVRVVAGAIAYQLLQEQGIRLRAFTSQIGEIKLPSHYQYQWEELGEVGCPDPQVDQEMHQLLTKVRQEGDTLGGVATVVVEGVPVGWGCPLYGKLDARLAEAMLGINACKGFEMGDGFELASMKGSQANDSFTSEKGVIKMTSNHSGGVLGGISSGSQIYFRVAFKPIPSIAIPQQTVTASGVPTEITIKGRHDASVFPRVLPIIEAMTSLVLVDEMLASKH